MKKTIYYSKKTKKQFEVNISYTLTQFEEDFTNSEEYIKNTKNLYVIIEKGKLKEIKALYYNEDIHSVIVEHKTNIREDIEINKLSKTDIKNLGINNVNYEISSPSIEITEKQVYIYLNMFEYWKIKCHKKDTWLHRSKLIDKIVFMLIGSFITLLLTEFIFN
ncbi:hypothetical protein [Galbibacter pacificus]|uniref:Uncharacterized protein n=1 Tax=Galbibacter pacificus TaxID=2996052 RepID=A0ABT6FRT9_9FLAO|nr:hypothetical protein [Galbibacter pacificus]MDG3581752.1 hypothetical protein [Galbibacter pacificus]MDG3585774.1 hypothetical protein [Galbibacter pacificus]